LARKKRELPNGSKEKPTIQFSGLSPVWVALAKYRESMVPFPSKSNVTSGPVLVNGWAATPKTSVHNKRAMMLMLDELRVTRRVALSHSQWPLLARVSKTFMSAPGSR
jgi:hypothetical protein